jgi:uncharacterized protein HemY
MRKMIFQKQVSVAAQLRSRSEYDKAEKILERILKNNRKTKKLIPFLTDI